jgi:hypothetical protein
MQRHPRDVACAEPAIPEQPLDQFAPDHTGGAENQNMQNVLLLFCRHCERSEAIQKQTRLDRVVALLLAMTSEFICATHSLTAPVIADT